MKSIGIIGSIIGIAISILAIYSLEPTSNIAFVLFSLWLSLPFFVTLALSIKHQNKIGSCVSAYASLLIGALLFMDIRYWHPDPQGGIAVFMLPFIFFGIIIGSISLTNAKNT